MRRHLLIYVSIFLATVGSSSAQDLSKIPDSPEQKAFDYWIGRWHREVGGKLDTTDTEFLVRRLPSGSILEQWRLKGAAGPSYATGVRSFDKAWNRWMYLWTSQGGHFQVWEGRRVSGNWYIYREFDIAGDRYLSRQGWLPEGPDRIMRISEKSYDGGVTWELRFREFYRRTG